MGWGSGSEPLLTGPCTRIYSSVTKDLLSILCERAPCRAGGPAAVRVPELTQRRVCYTDVEGGVAEGQHGTGARGQQSQSPEWAGEAAQPRSGAEGPMAEGLKAGNEQREAAGDQSPGGLVRKARGGRRCPLRLRGERGGGGIHDGEVAWMQRAAGQTIGDVNSPGDS